VRFLQSLSAYIHVHLRFAFFFVSIRVVHSCPFVVEGVAAAIMCPQKIDPSFILLTDRRANPASSNKSWSSRWV
jgi:hypothetical protein